LYTDLNACNENSEQGGILATFGTLTMPVTVIAAAEDKMTRAKDARAMAAALGHAKFVVIPDAGHNMMLEQPLEFNQVVRDALDV
jgi:pimeloyl-ACP methyl ester carboxylesterase